jgi:mono/diheme cytochrome c family protein
MRALAIAALVALAGCQDSQIRGGERLGGRDVSAAQLRRGERVYRHYCIVCHGEHGDGRGIAAAGLSPPPRDFTTARFKFAGIQDRGLPADYQLERTIRAGLAGTAMRGWPLGEEDLLAVVQYIKRFSRPGEGFRNPALVVKAPEVPPDPFTDQAARRAAVAEGERLYHSVFQCASCHPAYVSARTARSWGTELRATAAHAPVAKWSANYRSVLLPPDFYRHPLRSVSDRDPGPGIDLDPRDLYRVVAYGLMGPMPGYGDLGSREVWQVAYYVASLAARRGEAAAWAELDALTAADAADAADAAQPADAVDAAPPASDAAAAP